MLEDTIIAISTPFGYGGMGIVRLSGSQSLDVAGKLFRPHSSSRKIPPRRPVLGDLYNSESKKAYDEAVLTYFPAPHSYTTEDVVELSCHGSPIILEEVVRLGIKAGARQADHGEFTLRAYLHGRLDIIQAEAINDIIQASSLNQAKISYRQLEGGLSRRLRALRGKIIHLLAQIEASIEFPDEGLRITRSAIRRTVTNAIRILDKLIDSYQTGKSLREGISLALLGRANVGKSTLFNALLEDDRAIVTPYPGTTRDYLKEKILIEGKAFTIVDKAGMAVPSHPVEKEGIKRGKKIASAAGGLLLLFDASRKEEEEDRELISRFRGKKAITIFNKIDLPRKMDIAKVRSWDPTRPAIEISALKGVHLERLKEMIHTQFGSVENAEEEIILHLRQKLALEEIRDTLRQGLKELDDGHSEEHYAEPFREALSAFGRLTGEVKTEQIIEDIFSRFCVGK